MKTAILALLALAGLSCLADEPDEPVIPSYRWRATAGGMVPPGATEQFASGTVYLFDANTCSESTVLELVRGGTPLERTSYVIGKPLSDGLVPTSDVFGYDGEPTGQVWNAYMVVATDTHVFFSDRRPTCGVCLVWTDIAFESQADCSTNVYAKTDAFVGPGWYAADLQKMVSLDPGSGVPGATVTAADATAATNRVKVLSVDTAIVSDADYAEYFRLVATPQSAGTYLVKAELDAEKIELDKSLDSFAAQLAEIAASGETTVTVTIECKPGLCYRVKAASAMTGTYEAGTKSELAPGDEVDIAVPKLTGGQGFYKLEASAERPAKK